MERDKEISKFSSNRLPILEENNSCNFYRYKIEDLMKETSKLRKIVTNRGTLEILILLCCTTDPVIYITFRRSTKGFSKTLTVRLRELEKNGILDRQQFNEIPPTVEYLLTPKGRELVESLINLLHWMKKWSNKLYFLILPGSIVRLSRYQLNISTLTQLALYLFHGL